MKEHIIFALVEKIIEEKNELINKDFHFIQTCYESDGSENELKKSYRIYHKDGYCVDISKQTHLNEDFDIVQVDYVFCQSWDGFKKVDPNEFIKLLLEC